METLFPRRAVASSTMAINDAADPLTKLVAKNVADVQLSLGFTEPQAAAASGMKKKTYNNVVNARHSGKLETLAQVAKALTVEPWQLLLPSLPDDLKERRALIEVVHYYLNLGEEGKESIVRIAEIEAKHAGIYRKPRRPLPDAETGAGNAGKAAHSRRTA